MPTYSTLPLPCVEPKRCVVCDTPFTRARGETFERFEVRQHCGRACYLRTLSVRRTKPRVSVPCGHCGKMMVSTPGRVHPYCSRECSGANWGERRVDARTYATSVCDFCGSEFSHRTFEHRRFCSNACASNARVRNKGLWRPTGIERQVRSALESLGIAFEAEKRIGRFLVDAFLPELGIAIEVNGTYWHCDPRAYPNGPTSPIQEKAIERDRRKQDAVERAGFRLLILWEKDICERGPEQLLREALPWL